MPHLLVALPIMLASSPAPTPPATTTPTASPLVLGDTFILHSSVLGEDRRINVYKPPVEESGPLPVLYMPDGGMAEDFVHVAGLVEVGAGNETMRPFLLVGVENTQRRRDTTGPTTDPEDKKIAPVVGGSAAFRDFFAKELFPEIERRYAVTRERAIVGESLAGLFVVETLVKSPEMFDTYIAIDPSLWWNRYALLDDAKKAFAKLGTPRTLWVASSSEERGDACAKLATIVRDTKNAKLRFTHVPFPQEKHGTIYHPAALIAFRALLAPPPTPPSSPH